MNIVLLLILLLAIGAFPAWPHAASYGYGPFGGIVMLLIVLLALKALGVI